MPITHLSTGSSAWRVCKVASALILTSLTALVSSLSASIELTPAVGVVREVASSPNDLGREGACEFQVFLTVAQLQQESSTVGLLGVGNQNGRLAQQTERALEHVVLRGIPVVRLARGGGLVGLAPDALFIDASSMTEEQARQRLVECLSRFGGLPAVKDPSHPTETELNAIRGQLAKYRKAFTGRVAVLAVN